MCHFRCQSPVSSKVPSPGGSGLGKLLLMGQLSRTDEFENGRGWKEQIKMDVCSGTGWTKGA